MKTFFNILQSLTNIKCKRYPDEPFTILDEQNKITFEQSHVRYMINLISYIKKKNNNDNDLQSNIVAKFSALNQINNNTFNFNELKETTLTLFFKAQKCYHAFLRLANMYKIKKYTLQVTDDLSLNPLDLTHRNTFILIENKSTYLFSLNDLISIIETAISNSPDFFTDPLWPLNPYNKQPFSISTLYNIYFKMKYSGRLISTLFHYFFLENFNLFDFSEKYESCIREHAIKKYVFNSPYQDLQLSVTNMLKYNVYTKLLNIDKDFPKDVLVNIFRPFLYYYYIVNYDIKGTSKIYNYKRVLHEKLRKFYEYNKLFGRRYIKLTMNEKKRITKKEIIFNTDHISFYKISTSLNERERGIVIVGTNIVVTNLLDQNYYENDNDSNYDSDDEHDSDTETYIGNDNDDDLEADSVS
jgi:hypothetical protein